MMFWILLRLGFYTLATFGARVEMMVGCDQKIFFCNLYYVYISTAKNKNRFMSSAV